MKKSTLTFICAIAAAMGAGVLATGILRAAVQTQTIVVTTRDLSPFTQIEPTDVEQVTIPKTTSITGLAVSPSQVVGHYLSFAVPKGYPVTSGDLNRASSFSTFLTQYVKKTGHTGMLMALPVQSPLASVVQAGESIALLLPSQQNGAVAGVQTIEPVPVLNVMQPAKGGAPTDLLLFVSQQDYNLLAPAILTNSVQVGLIPQDGSFVAPNAVQLPKQNETPPTSGNGQPPGVTVQSSGPSKNTNGASRIGGNHG